MDEILRKEALELNKKGITKPLLFVIRPSYRCNSRCIMCDFWKRKTPGMEFNIIKNAIIEAKDLGSKEIRLTGGEPTIYPYFFEILKLTKELNLDVSIITNGFTLSENLINRLEEYFPKHIHVSVDSSRPETHNKLRGIKSFDNIYNGLKLLKEKRPDQKIVINYVVNNLNYEHIVELIELWGGKLFDELNLIPIRGNENLYLSKKQMIHYNEEIVPKINKLLKEKNMKSRHVNQYIFGIKNDELELSKNSNYTKKIYKNMGCLASKYSLFMDTNGAIYPCTNTPYLGEKFLLGNIYDKTLKEIINSKTYANKLKNAGNPKFCVSCDPVNCYLNSLANI
ncbi:MAG: radical SAM protein [archaeon]|jgi:radical SAM protein with 4Fe4S-binding SPASM domain